MLSKYFEFERTTIHGISDLATAKSLASKIFWSVVLLVCFGVLTYNIAIMAVDFDRSPMVTTVRTEFVDYFPAMMYCPYGVTASQEALEHYQLTEEDIIFLNDFLLDSHTMAAYLEEKAKSSEVCLQRLRAKLTEHNITLPQLLHNLTNTFRISVIYEIDGGSEYLDQVNSTAMISAFGICHRLHIPAVARRGNSPTFAILTMDSMQTIIPGTLREHYTYGILFLGENVNSFNPVMPSYIQDGMKNMLELKETKTMYRNSKNAPCDNTESSEMARRVYSCYDRATIRIANCSYVRSLDNAKDDIPLENLCHQFHNREGLAQTTESFNQCVKNHIKAYTPCTKTQYETSVSSMPHGSHTTDVLMQYRFPLIVVIEEHDMYTWQVFLSNVGGLISLVCGASVISITQFMYLVCKAWLKASKAKSVRRNAQRSAILLTN